MNTKNSFILATTLAAFALLHTSCATQSETPSALVETGETGEIQERGMSMTTQLQTTRARPITAILANIPDLTEKFNRSKAGPIRTLRRSGQTVIYEIVDGMAIMEGDIILGTANKMQQMGTVTPRGVAIDSGFLFGTRWPNGAIPYRFKSNLSNTMRGRVNSAIAHWEDKTRINLRPARSSDSHVVEFRAGTGCSSAVGRSFVSDLLTTPLQRDRS